MEDSLTGQMARGITWTGVSQAVDALVTVAGLSLLARLLAPSDFGSQALAGTVVGVALMAGDLGLGSALIQAPVLRREHVLRATGICLLSGLVLGCLLLGLSGRIGRTFGTGGEVGSLLRVMWVCAVLHPAGSVPRALLTRRMDFRTQAWVEAASAVAGASTAVGLAAQGIGAASLAWGYVARVGLSFLLSWLSVGRSLAGGEDRVTTGEGGNFPGLLRFGLQATGAGILNYLSANVDYLLIGRYLGPTALGLYYLAFQLVSILHFRVVSVLLRVLHPALASVQGDLQRLRRGYLAAIRGISLVVFPFLALLWAFSGAIVPALFGQGKEGAILLVEILCGMGAAKAVGGAVGPVFLARGRADVSLLWNAFALASVMVAVSAGLAFGVTGAAIGVSLNAILLLLASEAIVHRLVPLDFRAYFGALVPALWCSGAAAVAARGVAMLATPRTPSLVAPLFGAALGLAIYCGLLLGFYRGMALEVISALRVWAGGAHRRGTPGGFAEGGEV